MSEEYISKYQGVPVCELNPENYPNKVCVLTRSCCYEHGYETLTPREALGLAAELTFYANKIMSEQYSRLNNE